MHYGEVHVVATTRKEMIGERGCQGLTDARLAGLRIDCERPETGTVLHVTKCAGVVDPHDRTDNCTTGDVLRNEPGQCPG